MRASPYRPTRRVVLQGGVLVVASGLIGTEPAPRATSQPIDDLLDATGPTFVTEIQRSADLLDLRIEGFNVHVVDQPDGPWLRRLVAGQPAYLVVVFPPQSVLERAFAAAAALAPPPIAGATSGPSRLAFVLPPEGIPYSTEALLDWSQLEPRLVPVASGIADPGGSPGGDIGTGPSTPKIRAPHDFETAIELPWRLFLSPPAGAGWAHAPGLVTHNGWTEVWHTRLGVRAGGGVDEWRTDGRTVQAVWTPELGPLPGPPPVPIPTALTVQNRIDIVESTSDLELDGNAPATVNRLMLSMVGGWLDVHGNWQTNLSLEQWVHRASMGRDHYVRIVERGYLFPYGHRAAKITVTERQLEPAPGEIGAYLRKRTFIVVREPVKRYWPDPDTAGQPREGRDWPFREMRITTLVTPVLDDPLPTVDGVGEVPTVGGEPVRFHAIGTDRENRGVDFATTVVFVEAGEDLPADAASLIDDFEDLELDLQGQTVAMAAPDPAEPGRTALEISRLAVHAVGPDDDDLVSEDEPPFYPSVRQFNARLAATEQVSGGAIAEQTFELGPYSTDGFDDEANPGGVFAVIAGGPNPEVALPADRAGGIATPNLEISALSRELGAVGGNPQTIQQGTFDPAEFFKPGAAKLLGGIELSQIIKTATIQPGETKALRITTRPHHDNPDQPPVAIVTELDWDPDLQSDEPLHLFEPHTGGSLHIDATFRQDLLEPSQSTYEINGDLRDFQLNLVGNGAALFMIVNFDALEFHAGSERKTDLRPLINSVSFAGPLKFVERIKDYLTFGGSGPSIDLDSQGITAGYTLPLPQIPLGAVMLNNIAMSATLMIPWSGDPAKIRFALSSRENPFDVTYSCIGGGGFFGVAFGLDGLEKIECALEMGAYLSMDIGVLSGSISLSAGIYFEIEFVQVSGDQLTRVGLTAYFRFIGKVQALGIIGISLELYLGLGFELIGGKPKLVGVARAEFKIKVLFFSGTVRVKVERRIGSTPNDPTFADLFDEPHWVEYVNAFAPIGGA